MLRMINENPVGHGTHCMQPVEWVGRWKFVKGWTKVGRATGTLTSLWERGDSYLLKPLFFRAARSGRTTKRGSQHGKKKTCYSPTGSTVVEDWDPVGSK